MGAGGTRSVETGPPSISIVAPAHNEEGYLRSAVEQLVTGLRREPSSFEIVVCENGSTDRTRAIAEQLAAEYQEVRTLSLDAADYGRALRAGFLATTGDVVVNFDVDFIDLGFLRQALLLACSEEADIVIGSKRSPGADDSRPLSRRLVTGVFSGVLRYGFGLEASDTHGLKLLRKATTEQLVAACRSGADIFDTELVLRAERAGLRVREIPVKVVEQRPARTAIASRIPRTLSGLARLRLLLWSERTPATGRAVERPAASQADRDPGFRRRA